MNRRWVCNDVWMDIFPLFDRPQLGLKMALISPRFEALVDKHFEGKSELTLWKHIKICMDNVRSAEAEIFVGVKSVGFPLPDRPLPDKIRFESLHIVYIDHSVLAFLRANKRIFDKSGTKLELFIENVPSTWEVFVHEIFLPVFSTNIHHLIFPGGDHLDNLRRLSSPTILTDIDQLNVIDSDILFPDGIADDAPNASAGQALCQWLYTPRSDGQPKQLFCRFTGASEARELVNNCKKAFVRATTSVAYNIHLTISLIFPTHIFEPFELENEATQEMLTLQKRSNFGNFSSWVMKRCQFVEETAAAVVVQQQKNEALYTLNGVNFNLFKNCIGPLSLPSDQSDGKVFSSLAGPSDQRKKKK